jgi:hypothetical protein
VQEEPAPPGRPEDMSYPTYEDARLRERELLALARPHKVESAPRQQRTSSFSVTRVLELLHVRHVPAQTPAVGGAR